MISKNGLQSAVYERYVDGHVTEYAYVTAGTNDAADCVQDVAQVAGLSGQYSMSARNAKEISHDIGRKTELTYVGHSLGGGEAALNSMVTSGDGKGRKAVTFNAAGVGVLTMVANKARNTGGNVKAYVMITDPLNMIQNGSSSLGRIMPDVNGKRIYLLPKDCGSVVNGHSINSVLRSFGVNPKKYAK